jgi:Taurine catabolism dioxygenase TauD, TfdA family
VVSLRAAGDHWRPHAPRRLPSHLSLTYIRNYGGGLGLTWEAAFGTEDPAKVEAHCRREGISFAWGAGRRLHTEQVRPAVRRHPRTGELVWFNHALFFNKASYDPRTLELLLSVVNENELPYDTRYGDGTPIELGTLERLLEVYRAEQVSFPWHAGDVLLVDNMLVSHGREPYQGPRQVAVAMAEPYRPPEEGK